MTPPLPPEARLFTVPRMCCVYLLVRDGVVVYVGQSKNFLSRILSHNNKRYDSIYVIDATEAELLAIELRYIRKYQPEYNTAGAHKIKQVKTLNGIKTRGRKFREKVKGVWCPVCIATLPEHKHLGRV